MQLFVWFAAVASLLTASVLAQEPVADRTRFRKAASQSSTSLRAPGKVLPPDAITVLDPGVDPKGDPRPILRTVDETTDELTVEIPETVHVHRYFPTGPCEFQAQYFSGGPTIVCAKHPYTGERVYVHLDLSPGFPKVKYDENEIEYKYPTESFTIHFDKCGDITTSYSRCGAVKQKAKHSAEHLRETARDWSNRLGVDRVVEKVRQEAHETAAGTTERTRQFVAQSGNLFIGALNLVPGVQLVQSKAEDLAVRERDRAEQRVARERQRAEQFITAMP
jgi:hypothetical protein